MIKKGVYAASLSILNEDKTLNVDLTINHAVNIIKSGLHGVFFFGSTGQSQLISISEKKELIAKIASHKMRKQFFLGTGNNSLNENIELIKYSMDSPVQAYGKYSENIKVIVPEGETEETTSHDTLGAEKISFDKVLNTSIQLLTN